MTVNDGVAATGGVRNFTKKISFVRALKCLARLHRSLLFIARNYSK